MRISTPMQSKFVDGEHVVANLFLALETDEILLSVIFNICVHITIVYTTPNLTLSLHGNYANSYMYTYMYN